MKLSFSEVYQCLQEPARGLTHGRDLPIRCEPDERPNMLFSGVSIDSRHVRAGDLFVAIKGERFDGHDFIEQALNNGAVAVVIEAGALPDYEKLPALPVEDTRLALGQLAKCVREKFSGTVIAITGSNGKTTVKELVAQLLSSQYRVLSTAGNFNNEIGVPLTLFRLMPHDYDVAVIEMGSNHPGEMAYLTDIAQPNIATITNIGHAHMEGFGDIDSVLKEKTQIFNALGHFNALGDKGYAVVDADSSHYSYWQTYLAHKNVLTYGCADTADIQLSGSAVLDSDRGRGKSAVMRFTVKVKSKAVDQPPLLFETSLCGSHSVSNIQAAIATVWPLALSDKALQQGIAGFSAVPGRLQIKKNAHGLVIIDDTYNANIDSLKVAIDVLQGFSGKKILVLGDMQELGEQTIAQHAMAGAYAREQGIDALIAYGESVVHACSAFGPSAQCFSDMDQVLVCLGEMLASNQKATLLVKGSRSAHMERVVDAMLAQEATLCC